MTKAEKENKALELMREYWRVKQKLNDFGICRTEGEPLGDYAEWLVASRLDLEFANNTVQSGYDLIDPTSGKTYQVKARRAFKDHSYKISISKYDKYEFDYLIILIFNEDFSVMAAYQYTYDCIPLFFKSVPQRNSMELMFSIKNYKDKFEKVAGVKYLKI